MTGQVLQLFTTVFDYCVSWASQVYDSIQAKPFIYAAFIIALVASLLLLPLRGGGLSVSGRGFAEFTRFSGSRYYNGKKGSTPSGYKGKFSK